MEEGKYDAALDKIGILYDELEERARSGKDRESLDRIMELDRQRRALNDRLTQLEEDQAGARTSAEKQQAGKEEERLKADLRSLFAETERLMNDMEQ
jgi:seryl-tRNA synthetase